MYAIQYQRITGESGTLATRFQSEQKAHEAACTLRLLDRAKGRHGECDYNIIEITK